MSTPLSAEEKQLKINSLIKALGLKIVRDYTGNEDESTILKKEQAVDDTRAEKIKKLKTKIKKISKATKKEIERLKALTEAQQITIESMWEQEKKLNQEKNDAIELYKGKPELAPLLSLKNEIKENKESFEKLKNKTSVPKSLLDTLFKQFKLPELFSEDALFQELKLPELLAKKVDEKGMIQLTPEESDNLEKFLKFQNETIQKIYIEKQDEYLNNTYYEKQKEPLIKAITAYKKKPELEPLLSLKEKITKNKEGLKNLRDKTNDPKILLGVPKSILDAINDTINNEHFSRKELFKKFKLSELFKRKIDNETGMVRLTGEEYENLVDFLKFQNETIQKIYLDGQAEYLKKKSGIPPDLDNSTYYAAIKKQQELRNALALVQSQALEKLKNTDVVKQLGKELAVQENLLQQHTKYLEDTKKNGGTVKESPAHARTKLIMPTIALRREQNAAVAENVCNLLGVKTYARLPYIDCAVQYCIARLEQVHPSVEEALRKKCIEAGWFENEKKELILVKELNYGEGPASLSMSIINDLSYNTYVQVAEEKLGKREKPIAAVPAKPVVVHPPMLHGYINATTGAKSLTLTPVDTPTVTAVDTPVTLTVIPTVPTTVAPIDPPTSAPSAKLDPEFKHFCDAVVTNYSKHIEKKVDVEEAANKMKITSPPPWEIRKITPGKSEITIPHDDGAALHIILSAIKAAADAYPRRPVHINLQDPKQIEFAIAETNKVGVKHIITPDSQKILDDARAEASTKDTETPTRKNTHP
ncbi:MAG TPA: hypothetical protein PLL67_05155 [Gammaproteobacteria bacterium]|nr:hypothetical protein [Gammaproteobacteria bacterium]